jgi:hypothetical protein
MKRFQSVDTGILAWWFIMIPLRNAAAVVKILGDSLSPCWYSIQSIHSVNDKMRYVELGDHPELAAPEFVVYTLPSRCYHVNITRWPEASTVS